MNSKIILNTVCLGCTFIFAPAILKAAEVALPQGFEDIFNERQNGIFDIVYNDAVVASINIEYNLSSVILSSPKIVDEQITTVDMPALKVSPEALLKALSLPLKRVSQQGFNHNEITVWVNESDATMHLMLPSSMYQEPNAENDRTYILSKNNAGFIHNHNLNLLSDDYSDSFTFSSSDTLNLTGNSYIRSIWSYSQDIHYNLEELALYLENNSTRFKGGRQRLGDNFTYSTPSLSYSFFNPVSYDGISLGYMTDNYLHTADGASSPVSIYMPQAGTVEVYRNGRLIDLQQFPSGMQQLNTNSWPSGGYDVKLVLKLVNGSREEKIQPFFKRTGMFRSGDLEYSIQLGRYDQRQGHLLGKNTVHCSTSFCDEYSNPINNNNLASATLGYTTSSATSFGGGVLMDDDYFYYNSSVDVPVNLFFIERLYSDALLGNDGSFGYQFGANKSIYNMGFNVSYRDNRYKGAEQDYRRFGIVSAYDFNYLQFSASLFLPYNIGMSAIYSMNTLYQDYGRQNKTNYKTLDLSLNRDFNFNDNLNLRVDLGYHHGKNEYTNRSDKYYRYAESSDDRIFLQLTLGMRERSYNHYQSLYLRSKLSDRGTDENNYTADYTLNLDNPEFDRGGKYSVNASLGNGPGSQTTSGFGLTIDNRLGYSSIGLNNSYGNNNYQQFYLSQRGGFAIGDGDFTYGKLDDNAALIVDATSLPKDQYFAVQNHGASPVVVQGGHKTTLAFTPYNKVAPTVEQIYTGDTNAFYNLTTKSTSTWAMPGQAYVVKIGATKNQTVTGQLFYHGQPLANARVVGGNTLTDSDGLFIGDFTLAIEDKLTTLSVKKDGQDFTCPLEDHNIKQMQGVLQVHEVECEIQ
ncbi:outer membrane usher protein FimD/PapC [Enterobacter asburiae]|uniref:TcfC E-set like domain-containing protein n=1 Tax=Enterobacter asburiae TaxID=61645 RepID=UPI00141B802D|nr:TcfC E-set like domain-containing protein [Enterobacter asburiae]NIH92225.1 outer membrane usher protein FimD/PapC [Enterobacter asburiae]